MELIKIISIIFLLNCCHSPNAFDCKPEKDALYLINRIGAVYDRYSLYATRKDSTLKKVSKKGNYQMVSALLRLILKIAAFPCLYKFGPCKRVEDILWRSLSLVVITVRLVA